MKNKLNNKKALLLLLALMCSLSNMKAQIYESVAADGKEWSVVSKIINQIPFSYSYSTTTYLIDGDTVVDDIAYKKMYFSEAEYPQRWNLSGVIREDAQKRVFFREKSWDQTLIEEIKMYDFSLEPGDTIAIYEETPMILSFINEIEINGNVRNKFWFTYINADKHETWVEGIGSSLGIIQSGMGDVYGGEYFLLCHHENDELVWQNPEYGNCYISTLSVDENIDNEAFAVFPNPVEDIINIQMKADKEIQDVRLFDVFGREIMLKDSNSETIDVSELHSGIYFLYVSGFGPTKLLKR